MATRKPLRLASAIAALALATACAGQGASGGGNGGGDTGSGGGPVTLKFWNGFTGPDRKAVEGIVEKYNSSQNKAKIEMSIMPWDVFFNKLLPSLGSGTGPDIAAMDTVQIPQYAARNVFQPLDDVYGTGNLDPNVLVKSAADATTFQGKKYGVPMNFTTLKLYWNKDMFKKAGLDPEKPPADWDQLAQYAKKLTKDTNGDGKPEQYGISLADHDTIAMWPIFLWQNGGGVVSDDGKTATLDDPATIEAAKRWTGLVTKDKISPIGQSGGDADKLFQSKKAAMEIVGPWMTTGFKDAGIDFGIAMPPAGPKAEVTLGTSVAFTLSSRATGAKKDAAVDFMSFWNAKEQQVYWSVNSGFPPNRTDITAEEIKENPYSAAFGENADKTRFWLNGVRDYQKVNDDIFVPAMQRVLNGKGTVEEVFAKADKDVQALLDSAQ
ncbi:ABC transporter substrate-binding protein [Sphaerisporangium rufum]|uniref:ABC transporter substrate-binding protein n=1 Tax=Sphaerisporangium rufum TaxID=1381558 RepID=A0A919UZY2_9ACTN|nr:ABC transporter substrate-binding protein [Sphaerisporangium rufum]GII76797.1 ABC transporter substrate-binding protein [Sphaerisporangium rufum]